MIKLVKKSNEIRIYILSNENILHFSCIANIKHFADINKWAIWFSTTRNILLIFKELLHNILSFFYGSTEIALFGMKIWSNYHRGGLIPKSKIKIVNQKERKI